MMIPTFDALSPRPAFDIKIEGKTLAVVNDRLLNLALTDNRGFEADTLELTLDDSDGKLAFPKRGAKIGLSLGWKGEALIDKGIFIVDEIAHQGPPDRLMVTARSADFRDTFNVKHEQSWHDITVGAVVATIAARYQLESGVSEDLAHVEIDHADQTNESDISFLTRMAEMLGAIATIKNGVLLFMHPGKAISKSGKMLPSIEVTRAAGDRHNFSISDRDAYTGVSAYWLDLSFGQPQKVGIKRKQKTPPTERDKSTAKEGNYMEGKEGNVFVIRKTYKTERAAKRAAAAKWDALQRGAAVFSITLAHGRADLFPELIAEVSGFKPDIDSAEWIIKRCVHHLDDNGFTTDLELELKISRDDMAEG